MANAFAIIQQQTRLAHPDFTRDCDLRTDASDVGMRRVLTQRDNLIGLFSRKLPDPQTQYTAVEKASLAVIGSLNHFRALISNARINIYTDSPNQLFTANSDAVRTQRRRLLLAAYNYTLQHVPGIQNQGADLLSRDY